MIFDNTWLLALRWEAVRLILGGAPDSVGLMSLTFEPKFCKAVRLLLMWSVLSLTDICLIRGSVAVMLAAAAPTLLKFTV